MDRQFLKYSFFLSVTILLFSFASMAQVGQKAQTKATGNNESNFTGAVSAKMYSEVKGSLNCTMGSVSFQPGARTKWHKHPGGQILLITDGAAFYQERGEAKRILKKGEAVSCPPNVEHWHGAAGNVAMTHLTVGPNKDKGAVIWLEKVEDDVYLK